MIDPLSVAVGVGVSFIIAMAILGFILFGYRRARSPDYIVDMREVSNFYIQAESIRSLRGDEE